MTSTVLRTVTTVGAIGAGVTGGVYFTFSAFVMTALRKLPTRQGVGAMQAINRAAPTAPFMTVLFGTAAVAAGLVVVGVRRWGQPGAIALVSGAVLFLVSTAITIGFNVPRNDALAKLDPAAADLAASWSRYVSEWTAGNSVRAVTAIAGAVLLTLATRDTD